MDDPLGTPERLALVERMAALGPDFTSRSAAVDREAKFPVENWHDLRAAGFLGLCIPESDGGLAGIVLGRDGHDAPHRTGLIGSVANGVMRKTAKSTLIVPSTAAQSGPIVLAFDGSPGSRIGANVAVQIATRLGEPIHVFVDSKDKGRAVARFEEVRVAVGLTANKTVNAVFVDRARDLFQVPEGLVAVDALARESTRLALEQGVGR